jgi:circadian clock protein KaiC
MVLDSSKTSSGQEDFSQKTENKVWKPKAKIDMVQTGVNGLDKISGGGFPKNNVITLRGEAGTGKTILCLQYLYYGAKKYNESGVFLSFAESREAIIQHGATFGWDLQELEKKDMLAVIRYEPHEVVDIMEEGGGTIRDIVESMGAKRLVIDSLTAYALLFSTPYKAVESILALFEMLNRWETTSLVTLEHPFSLPEGEIATENLGFLADGIVDLYHTRNKKGERIRMVEVVKMRDSSHSNKMHNFRITSKGVELRG